MKTIFEKIGEKIASWLESQGETQSFFAERMGISKQVMSKIVNGKKAINIDEIAKIASIIGVTVDEILRPKETPQVIQEPILFMIGKLENENTKEGLQFLNHVMNEMIELEDNELCAFVCKKKGRVFVYINTFIPREKQVFAAAHELYHIWYDQDKLNQTEILNDQVLENDTDDVNELKANLFAALLLVPTEVLYNELISRGIQKDSLKIEDIVRLMVLFYVPLKTIVRPLFEIQFIDDKKMRELLTVPDRDP